MVFVAFELSEEACGDYFIASVFLEGVVHLVERYWQSNGE